MLLRDPVFSLSPVEVGKRGGGRLPGTSGRGPGFFGPLFLVVWVGVEKGLPAFLFLKAGDPSLVSSPGTSLGAFSLP